jgi:hypothetical protein
VQQTFNVSQAARQVLQYLGKAENGAVHKQAGLTSHSSRIAKWLNHQGAHFGLIAK